MQKKDDEQRMIWAAVFAAEFVRLNSDSVRSGGHTTSDAIEAAIDGYAEDAADTADVALEALRRVRLRR